MTNRLRHRTALPPTPAEKLAWAEARLASLRGAASEAMRGLMAELEEAATRLEFAAEDPELRAELTRFAARGDAIDRMSLDMLYAEQIARELRAAGVGVAALRPALRPAPPPDPVPAAPAGAGMSQADIDALLAGKK